MLEQQAHDRGLRGVVGRVESEFFELRVLPDEFARVDVDCVDDGLELRLVERGFQVFDDVELDVTLSQQIENAAGGASAGVVVHGDLGHTSDSTTGEASTSSTISCCLTPQRSAVARRSR